MTIAINLPLSSKNTNSYLSSRTPLLAERWNRMSGSARHSLLFPPPLLLLHPNQRPSRVVTRLLRLVASLIAADQDRQIPSRRHPRNRIPHRVAPRVREHRPI